MEALKSNDQTYPNRNLKYICLGFPWIPRKTGRPHFLKIQLGKSTVWFTW